LDSIEDVRGLIKKIIYAYHAQTDGPLTLLKIVYILNDMGVIQLSPRTTVHLYRSHPLRVAVAKIVMDLYKCGELKGVDDLRPSKVIEHV
jgi:hypothetical protein